MRVSTKFLSDYIDVSKEDYNQLASSLALIGNEVESVSKVTTATSLVVGKVLTCTEHPDSDHLHVCKVDIGGEVKQIVCGAPNVKEGIKVIVARVGAVLPGGTIKESTIRGVASSGMLCSLEELGIESKYVPERSKNGIHILEDDAPVGADAVKYLEYDDTVIDLELTANRNDLLNIIGVAYEVSAMLDRPMKLPEQKIKLEGNEVNNELELLVDTHNCSLYLAGMVKNLVIKESPNFIKARLMASGIRPINNVVDISNYVMLEYGQPLHFYDYKKLGGKIVVRMANDGEKLTTLDGVDRVLKETDIVITNSVNAVGLAGVMGGLSTEVDSNTTDVVIEAAIFNPMSIRNTSKNILKSEASTRFERGLDPNRTYMAIARAIELLEKYASGKRVDGIIVHDNSIREPKVITITKERICNLLGIELTKEDILNVFRRLDFPVSEECNVFTVTVPTRRMDISIEEDLVEEVGRIHGYHKMRGTLAYGEIKCGKYESMYKYIKNIKSRLSSIGLNEVITYSLVNKNTTGMFTNDSKELITILDPMSEEHTTLRYSLLPSLLEVVDYNLARNNKNINIYEIGKRYYKNDNEYKEEYLLSSIMLGTEVVSEIKNKKNDVDFYTIKGKLENILDYLGFAGRYSYDTNDLPKEFHPYQSARVFIDNNFVGYIGLINPTVCKQKAYMFEVNLEIIKSLKVRGIKAKDVPKYPSISKDMAFVFDKNVLAAEVLKEIRKQGGKTVNASVFDVYDMGDKKSLAFNLIFQDETRTLMEDEVMVIFNKIIDSVVNKFGAELRNK